MRYWPTTLSQSDALLGSLWRTLCLMNVRVTKTVASDRLILVNSAKLMAHIDQEDISCREANTIKDEYHKDWFHESSGVTYFTPPAAYIENGRIKFINGRHRCILLARHLQTFPFLIGNIDSDHIDGKPTSVSLDVMSDIKEDDLEENTIFRLPELEFGEFNPA